jgi:hypothetical protein
MGESREVLARTGDAERALVVSARQLQELLLDLRTRRFDGQAVVMRGAIRCTLELQDGRLVDVSATPLRGPDGMAALLQMDGPAQVVMVPAPRR